MMVEEKEEEVFEHAVPIISFNSGCSLKFIDESAEDITFKGNDDEENPVIATRHDTLGSCSDDREIQVGIGCFWKCAPVMEIVTSIA
jgi:hypothetical protein